MSKPIEQAWVDSNARSFETGYQCGVILGRRQAGAFVSVLFAILVLIVRLA